MDGLESTDHTLQDQMPALSALNSYLESIHCCNCLQANSGWTKISIAYIEVWSNESRSCPTMPCGPAHDRDVPGSYFYLVKGQGERLRLYRKLPIIIIAYHNYSP